MNWPARLPESRWSRRTFQILVVIAAVGILALGAWGWYRLEEAKGQASLASALILVQRAEAEPASGEARARAIEALEAVLSQHSRLSAAPQVAYYLGNLRYAAKEYAAARAAYELTLAKGATGSLRALAALGIGYAWEAEKKYPEAQAAYERALLGLTGKDFLYEEAAMSLARVQETSGKVAAALETYRRILKEVPDTRRADELKSRVASLASRGTR
jgi:tetratricopeptide (TPR) repeat protein